MTQRDKQCPAFSKATLKMANKKNLNKDIKSGVLRLSPLIINMRGLFGSDPEKAHEKLISLIGTHSTCAMITAFVGVCMMSTDDKSNDIMMPYFLLAPSVRQIANICRSTPLYQRFKNDKKLKEWERSVQNMPPHVAVMGFMQALRQLSTETLRRNNGEGGVMPSLITMMAINLPAIQTAAQTLMEMEETPDVSRGLLGAGEVTMMSGVLALISADFRRLFKQPKTSVVTDLFTPEFLFKLDTLLTLTNASANLLIEGKVCSDCAFDDILMPLILELYKELKEQSAGLKITEIIKTIPVCCDDGEEQWRDAWLAFGVSACEYEEETPELSEQERAVYSNNAISKLDPACATVIALASIQRFMEKSNCNCKRGIALLSNAKDLN